MKNLYLGPLGRRYLTGEYKKAYQSLENQKQRCYNKNCRSYKYYGEKGIKVKYTSREFIGWWIEQQNKLNLKKPTISRIDHSGHYDFDNIKLEEHRDNCGIDVIKRHGVPSVKMRIPCVVFDAKSKDPLMVFKSISFAAKMTNTSPSHITGVCKKRKSFKSLNGYYFEYLYDWQNSNHWYKI